MEGEIDGNCKPWANNSELFIGAGMNKSRHSRTLRIRVVSFPAVQLQREVKRNPVPVDHNHPEAAHEVVREAGDRQPRAGTSIATLGGRSLLPNFGIPLDLNWVQEVRVNTSAVERRAQSQVARRTVKKEWQAAWLLRAISCMDLTTLSGDDTEERVRRLCAKARHPVQQDLVHKLGIDELEVKV